MKSKVLSLIVLCLSCVMSNVQGQIFRVSADRISDPLFKKLTYVYSKSTLPYWESKNVSLEYMRTYQQYRSARLSPSQVSPVLPAYAQPDQRIEDSEQRLMVMFYDTNGDYIIGLISSRSGDHRSYKYLLVTYALSGEVLDYLVFYEKFDSRPKDINLVEGCIHKDLTVDIYSLQLNESYPVRPDLNPKQGLHGQRVDRHYKITPQGKFHLTQEVKYQQQDYSPEQLTGPNAIVDGNEIPE